MAYQLNKNPKLFLKQLFPPTTQELKVSGEYERRMEPGHDCPSGMANFANTREKLDDVFSTRKAGALYLTDREIPNYQKPTAFDPQREKAQIKGTNYEPYSGIVGGLRDQAVRFEALAECDKITTANKFLREIPQNIEAAQYVLGRDLTPQEIANRSITENLNYLAPMHTKDAQTQAHVLIAHNNAQRNHAATQSVAAATVAQSAPVIHVAAPLLPSPPTLTKSKSQAILDQADDLLKEIDTSLSTPRPTLRKIEMKTPATNRSVASTQLASTPIRSSSLSESQVDNLSYDELKQEAIALGFIPSVHYNKPGKPSGRVLKEYIKSILGRSLQTFTHTPIVERPVEQKYDSLSGQPQTGSGIRSRDNVILGNLLVDRKKLEHNNILSLQFAHNKKKPTNLPNTHVSPTFKIAMITLLSGTYPHAELVKMLSLPERNLLKTVLRSGKIHGGFISSDPNLSSAQSIMLTGNTKPRNLMSRLYLNLGGLSSGSDSPILKQQTSNLLSTLSGNGIMSAQKANDIRKQFSLA